MLGPPLTGLLFDYTGSFDWTFYIAGLFFLISFSFCYLIKLNESPSPTTTDPTENLKTIQ